MGHRLRKFSLLSANSKAKRAWWKGPSIGKLLVSRQPESREMGRAREGHNSLTVHTPGVLSLLSVAYLLTVHSAVVPLENQSADNYSTPMTQSTSTSGFCRS